MIDIEKTLSLRGYDPLMLTHGSAKSVWAVCKDCKEGRWVRFQNYTDLCQLCANKLRCALPKPESVEEKDRFILNTGIDRIETIKVMGYDPADLEPKSSKRVWSICQGCGDGRWLRRQNYTDLCHPCGQKLRYNPKPKFVPNEDRFISNTGIDRIITIEKMGYDPADLSQHSSKKVWTICQDCGDGRLVYRFSYFDLCNKCCKKGKFSGVNNSNWKGGITADPYCEKFNGTLRQQIRDQYSNCDFLSGLSADICNIINGKVWKLDVHHVDSNKNQGCDEVKWKLIPLSKKNHMRMNGNRTFWGRLICYALEYDKTYYTDEIKDIFVN